MRSECRWGSRVVWRMGDEQGVGTMENVLSVLRLGFRMTVLTHIHGGCGGRERPDGVKPERRGNGWVVWKGEWYRQQAEEFKPGRRHGEVTVGPGAGTGHLAGYFTRDKENKGAAQRLRKALGYAGPNTWQWKWRGKGQSGRHLEANHGRNWWRGGMSGSLFQTVQSRNLKVQGVVPQRKMWLVGRGQGFYFLK